LGVFSKKYYFFILMGYFDGGVFKNVWFFSRILFFLLEIFYRKKRFYHGMCYRFVISIMVIFYYKEHISKKWKVKSLKVKKYKECFCDKVIAFFIIS